MVPQTLGKITRLRELLDKTGHEEVFIEVDGNVSFENAPKITTRVQELLYAALPVFLGKMDLSRKI